MAYQADWVLKTSWLTYCQADQILGYCYGKKEVIGV